MPHALQSNGKKNEKNESYRNMWCGKNEFNDQSVAIKYTKD